MSFAVGKRLMHTSLVVLLIVFVLQIWVCSDCQAEAIRIFPQRSVAEVKESHIVKAKENKEDLFHKYFNGREFGLNRTEKGFEESKRRVPSCPDPLHN